jgi:SAM-dependent methyltransferase
VSIAYQIMYRIGFKPWDNDRVPPELAALVEGRDALAPGRALDVGCGTGTQAVFLARAGWRGTGIDAVEQPLGQARRRAACARGVTVLAAPGARLLMMAFARNRKLVGPTGADERRLVAQFAPEWELVSAQPDGSAGPPGPMRDVPRTWYQFMRR